MALASLRVEAQQRSFIWWSPPVLSSLPDIDSIAVMRNDSLVLFDFEHALSLYRWGTSIYATSEAILTTPKVSIGAEGRSRLRQDTRVRTSEAGVALGLDYPLESQTTSALFSASATSYSLDQKATTTLSSIGKLSSINDGYASLGARHQFSDVLSTEAFGGLTIKAVEGRESTGPIIRGRITMLPYDLDEGLSINGGGYLEERQYKTTKEVLRNDGAYVALTSNFAGGGYNIARTGFGLKRRDFFFPRDTSTDLIKQERSEFSFTVHDEFYYPIISNKFTALVSVDIAPRTVSRRTPDVDLATLSSQFLTGTTFLAPSTSSLTASTLKGGLDYIFSDGVLSGEIRYEERAEDNALRFEDAQGLSTVLSKKVSEALNATSFEARSTVAGLRLTTALSSADMLNAEINARIYRFDTPSAENVDDRDEQYLYSILRYEHTFASGLEFLSEIKAAQGHLVYIKSDRSAQNNRTRKLALTNGVRLSSKQVRNTISGEVFANYTEYDFVLPTSLATNDFIIRGLSALDSFFVTVGTPATELPPWGISFRGEYRISERGTFNSVAFAERPLLETSELLVESLVQSTYGSLRSPLLVRLGVRGFFLSRRSAHEERKGLGLSEDERSSRVGPLITVIIDHSSDRGMRLFGSLWYGFTSTTSIDRNVTTFGTQVEARLVAQWQF